MTNGSSYDYAIRLLISINRENRVKYNDAKIMYPLYRYVREFCTISVDVGRGVGKTEFIQNHASYQDLVIVFSKTEKERLAKKIPAIVLTPDEIVSLRPSRIFETIYIDEPDLVFRYQDKDTILKNIIFSENQTIIMLGK